MKRMVLATGVGLALGAAVGEAAAGEVRAGLFLGTNLATVRIEDAPPDVDPTTRTSFAFGGVVAIRLGESWTLDLRPAYVGRGAKVLVAGVETEIQSPALELELAASREFGRGGVRPYALAGAALAHRTSATAVSPAGEQDIADNFASTDTSLRLGAGVRFRTVSSQPFLEVEYAWGLKNLNEQAVGLGAGLGAIHNRGLQIRAGLTFRLGK